MLIGKDDILEWIEINETPCWQIRRSEKGAVIFPYKPDDPDLATSKGQLDKVLSMLGPGSYFIEAYKHGAGPNTWLKTAVRIGSGDSAGGIISGFDPDTIKGQVKTEILKEMEFERLKQENEEMKLELDSVSHNLSKRIYPYIGILAEHVLGVQVQETGQPGPVAGVPDEQDQQLQRRLEIAFSKWIIIEKELHPVELIEKIVHLAETDRKTYEVAKKILTG